MAAMLRSMVWSAAMLAVTLAAGVSAEPGAAPDPPHLDGPEPAPVTSDPFRAASSVPTEWTFHRTADGVHPDADEQSFLWLMNRARRDPEAEGVFLAEVDDFDVQNAIQYFAVDLELMMDEFAALDPQPPAAFDTRLYAAALDHSLDLIDRDAQDHQGQFSRVSDAGFHYVSGRGSVFSYTRSAIHGHAGFNIDWGGNDGSGMQTGRGHRQAIMGNYPNVGLAAVPDSDPTTSVGPLVVTANYMWASTSYLDHFNRFLVGTVWEDLDEDGVYDPGEGIGGVVVQPEGEPYYAVSASAGGYAVPVTRSGSIVVAFSGSGVGSACDAVVDFDLDSQLLDCRPDVLVVPEPASAWLRAVALLAVGAVAQRRRRA